MGVGRARDGDLERGVFVRGEAERLGEEGNRVAVGGAAGAPLEIADGARAKTGAFGERLLRQPARPPVAPE